MITDLYCVWGDPVEEGPNFTLLKLGIGNVNPAEEVAT